MAPSKKTTVVAKVASSSPYQLNSEQTLRATKALVRKIQSDVKTKSAAEKKESLLADADDEDSEDVPVWLVLTTKKHVVDKKRLKPGKIVLPHPYINAEATGEAALRICLITADPQRKYKDMITEPSFPTALSQNIQRVIGIEKLKKKYSSFESKRQLLGEYDVFLADDRVITYLPTLLGKTFYKSGAKRPIPVSLEGRRQNVDEAGNKRIKLAEGGTKVTKAEANPAELGAEISKALSSALVHLAPSTTTAVKVGTASQEPAQLQANVEAVVNGLIEKFVPQQWRNVRAVHIKGPNTAALPIWLTEELWAEETQVLEQQEQSALTDGKKRKRGALAAEEDGVIEVPGADGKMRRLEKPSKRKSTEASVEETKKSAAEAEDKATEKIEKAARKEAIKAQKLAAKNEATVAVKKAASKAKPRMKAADLN